MNRTWSGKVNGRLAIACLLSLGLHGWLLWALPAPPPVPGGGVALSLGELRLNGEAPGAEARPAAPAQKAPAQKPARKAAVRKRQVPEPRPQRDSAGGGPREGPERKHGKPQPHTGAGAQTARAPDIGAGGEPVLVDRPAFASPPQPPHYPRLARSRRQQGTVVIEVQLGRSGEQVRRRIVQTSGVDSLDRAALAAVESWRFLPYRENGRPRPSRVRLPIRFTL